MGGNQIDVIIIIDIVIADKFAHESSFLDTYVHKHTYVPLSSMSLVVVVVSLFTCVGLAGCICLYNILFFASCLCCVQICNYSMKLYFGSGAMIMQDIHTYIHTCIYACMHTYTHKYICVIDSPYFRDEAEDRLEYGALSYLNRMSA